ncbi:hypothetical protein F4824DRAFT_438098 [Ustulina deusta]|nr:hypothetical protein F4824DRAFT_438098 [Ustulina deusta]
MFAVISSAALFRVEERWLVHSLGKLFTTLALKQSIQHAPIIADTSLEPTINPIHYFPLPHRLPTVLPLLCLFSWPSSASSPFPLPLHHLHSPPPLVFFPTTTSIIVNSYIPLILPFAHQLPSLQVHHCLLVPFLLSTLPLPVGGISSLPSIPIPLIPLPSRPGTVSPLTQLTHSCLIHLTAFRAPSLASCTFGSHETINTIPLSRGPTASITTLTAYPDTEP